ELGKRRPVEYRDIVILMRSPAKRVEDYVQVLRLAQVPVSSPDSGGYLEATEIRDCVVLLKVLDNLQRDIELAALLRSPFFSVSDSELVKIRLQRNRAEKGSFSGCLLEYSQKGRDRGLAEKLKGILSQIERWRRIGRRGNLSELIWRIFRETSFLSFVSALPNGDSRRANLLKLHDRAIQFEGFASNGGVASLRRFVEFLEKIEEAGYEWSSAEPEGEVRNAVRIMSVHKSKGLEFGVVFLAELNSQFNMKELSGDILADGGNTLGIQIIDRQANGRLSSLAHQVIAEEKRLKRLAEEMRILYVAMTRAREKLILTACEKRKKCEEIISNGYFFGDKGPADWQVESSKSPLEWILYGLAGEQRLHDAFETGLSADEGSGDLFSIKLYGNAELGRLDDYILGLKGTGQKWSDSPARKSQGKKPAADLMLKVKESLDWRYGFEAATKLGAKSSVTRLTHLDDEYVKTDYSGALGRQPKAVLSGVPAEVVDSRIVGTATHLVISKLDLTVPVSKAAVEETIERLLTDGAISETVGGHVPVDGIVAFFESGLGRKVLGAEQHWREWPFSFAVPVSMISDLQLAAGGPIDDLLSMEDESIIVQGIIDMVAGKGDEVIIIDFKTDYVSDKEVSERAKAYRRQLGLYALAAAEILRAGRVEKWLYFLRQGREFRVD
ncbi:MAG: 3'-5' exonuclease, partial [Planctomycetota bacterium]